MKIGILQIYLFAGLLVHKAFWEILKRRASEVPTEKRSWSVLGVKAVKIAILVGIAAQIFAPEILPVTANPAPLRAIGTFIYTLGLLTALVARLQLGENWANIETGQVLRNQKVVARGVYALVRHPIYTGDLLLLLGLELALNSWLFLGVFALAPVVMYKALQEEQMLRRELAGYETYCAGTKRFIPYII
jgi:protein-S-isoprenylcysteine O-methyltransferase Ste14